MVEFGGTVDGVQHDHGIQVDNGEWGAATDCLELEVGEQDWSFNWDSTTVSDTLLV